MIAFAKQPEPRLPWWRHPLANSDKFMWGLSFVVGVCFKALASLVFFLFSKSFTFSTEALGIVLFFFVVGCGLMASAYYEISRRKKDAASVPENAASATPTERHK